MTAEPPGLDGLACPSTESSLPASHGLTSPRKQRFAKHPTRAKEMPDLAQQSLRRRTAAVACGRARSRTVGGRSKCECEGRRSEAENAQAALMREPSDHRQLRNPNHSASEAHSASSVADAEQPPSRPCAARAVRVFRFLRKGLSGVWTSDAAHALPCSSQSSRRRQRLPSKRAIAAATTLPHLASERVTPAGSSVAHTHRVTPAGPLPPSATRHAASCKCTAWQWPSRARRRGVGTAIGRDGQFELYSGGASTGPGRPGAGAPTPRTLAQASSILAWRLGGIRCDWRNRGELVCASAADAHHSIRFGVLVCRRR